MDDHQVANHQTVVIKKSQLKQLVQENASKPTDAEPMVYIGPGFARVVQENTSFKNGVTPHFQQILEQHPFLKDLLVPVSGLAEGRKQVKDPGSRLSVLYQEAKRLGGNA